jgi:hypothetical protein
LTNEAQQKYHALKNDTSSENIYKAVKKTLKFLAINPRHNSLQTHKYQSIKGKNGDKIFESYAQQRTPSAYRVFWSYGPFKKSITILSITPHP